MDEWVNKMSYILTMEYYSALKKMKVLTQATAYMNLKDVILNEISQSQKKQMLYNSTYIRHLVKIIVAQSRMWLLGTRGRQKWWAVVNGTEFQFCKLKRVLETGCTNVNILNTTELYT